MARKVFDIMFGVFQVSDVDVSATVVGEGKKQLVLIAFLF